MDEDVSIGGGPTNESWGPSSARKQRGQFSVPHAPSYRGHRESLVGVKVTADDKCKGVRVQEVKV